MEKAVAMYVMAAQAGEDRAQTNLGSMYRQGNGVEKNPAEALKWYMMAGAKNVVAANIVGEMYAAGEGVKRDDKAAVEWFYGAAERGFAAAQNNLAAMYAKGRGLKRDPAQAYKWYSLAANTAVVIDAKTAAQGRADMAKKLKPEQIAALDQEVTAWRPYDGKAP
jgi:TPR repeat protein